MTGLSDKSLSVISRCYTSLMCKVISVCLQAHLVLPCCIRGKGRMKEKKKDSYSPKTKMCFQLRYEDIKIEKSSYQEIKIKTTDGRH